MLFELSDLIKKYNLKIRGVLHIGAHLGQEYKAYKANDISKVIFFEPLPHIFRILKNNIPPDFDTEFFEYALGDKEGFVKMYVDKNNQGMSSSVLKPKLHLELYPGITFENEIKVVQKRLDDIEFNRLHFNYISIDVQGYELNVFKGATNTLEFIDYIMAEVSRAELYTDCVLVEDLDSYLSDFGFKRVETTWDGGLWGDALYIKA